MFFLVQFRKAFGQGIAQGDKQILHPVLEWLLRNLEDLRKRAYLAKFLVKLEVPPEILGDADIAAMYEQVILVVHSFLIACSLTYAMNLIFCFSMKISLKNSSLSTKKLKQ